MIRALAALAALATAVSAFAVCKVQTDGTDVRIDVDLSTHGNTSKRAIVSTPAAKNAFKRYANLAMWMCPVTIARSGKDDKDLVWYLGVNHNRNALAFVTHNATDEDKTITFRLPDRKVLAPTYRRIYSTDHGKTWHRMAFEPPHPSISGCQQSMAEPWIIEVPAHTYQTATVRLK